MLQAKIFCRLLGYHKRTVHLFGLVPVSHKMSRSDASSGRATGGQLAAGINRLQTSRS